MSRGWCYGVLLLAVVGCTQREPVPAPPRATSAVSTAGAPARSGLMGEPARLVKDINLFPASGAPLELVNFNGTLYFTADDGERGRELWKSDGTAQGTVLVTDIFPGPNGSRISALMNFNGTLYFAADDGVRGMELWKSDGTAAGTVLVKDIYPGRYESRPAGLMQMNGFLYFTADDGERGVELWKSDGTAAGTVLVKDIYAGVGGAYPSELTGVNGVLFFAASDSVYGTELWSSDGTASGTRLVKDIDNRTQGSSSPAELTPLGGTLYFTAFDSTQGVELWKSDGTAAGTVLVKDIFPGSPASNPSDLVNVNGTLFFRANDGVTGTELWKSDGTAAGTLLVKDISPGNTYSLMNRSLTDFNGTLFFCASDGATGSELWKSDGTAAGTVLVKDLLPGPGSAGPSYLTTLNGRLYFSVTSTTETGLWRSDGTEAGTVLIQTIPAKLTNGVSTYLDLTDVQGTLYFRATDDATGTELWKSDGTAAGTVRVKDLRPGSWDSSPANLTAAQGTLFFAATDGATTSALWKSDGTTAGTVPFTDFLPASDGFSSPSGLTEVHGTLFFTASSRMRGTELWKSDGTAAGTVLVKDIAPGAPGSSPSSLVNVNGTLFFRTQSGTGNSELWKSDGTEAGTVPVGSGTSDSFLAPSLLTNVQGTLFFFALTNGRTWGLWKSDGTTAGTVLLKSYAQRSTSSSSMKAVNGTLFFTLDDGASGVELWKSDGTAAGTVLVKGLWPRTNGLAPAFLMNVNGTLYFSATSATSGVELWKSDGTAAGTVLVKDIFPGSSSSQPVLLTSVGDTLYFRATDGVSGVELWKSDGTAAGTVLVTDLWPGADGSTPSVLANVGGTLYLRADDGVHGPELWKSDGTAAGTLLLQEFFPGVMGGAPSLMARMGERLFFAATSQVEGRELWRLELDGTPPTVTCPADPRALATGASGARVTYPPATATDDKTASPRLTYSVDSGALFPIGSTAVTVTATDDAGNSARCGFSVEVLPPAPTVSAPRDGESSRAPVAVAGTALEGARVSALEEDAVLGTFTADGSGAFGGSLALESRVYRLRFIQTLGGFTSAPTAVSTVSVRPPPPDLTAPPDGLDTSMPGVSVSGSGVPGATVLVQEGEAVLGSFPVTAAGTFSGSLSLGYGVHVLRFTQRTSGGSSEEFLTRTVTVRPSAPLLTRPTQGMSLVGPLVRVEGTGVSGATVRVFAEDTAVGTFTVVPEGTFAGQVTLAYGTHRLTAVQTAGGQSSTASAPVSLEVRPPVPEVMTPAEGSIFDRPRVVVTGRGVPGARVEVGEAGTVLVTLMADASGDFAGEVELAPGTHRLTFVQQVNGTTSDPRGPRSVSVRPPAPVLTAPASQARVLGPEVLLEGTALAGARVVVEESGQARGGTSADAAGAFRLRVALAYGPRSLALRQEVDGLAGPAHLAEFTVLPAPPRLAQPLDGATVGRDVEVRGTGLPGARISLRDGTEVLATADADADGAFRADVSLAYGPHTLTAVQRVQGEDSDASAPVHLNARFNRAPLAEAQELSVAEDGRLAVTLTAHDADGDSLGFTVRTPPAHGVLEGSPPALTYVPGPDFQGADRFTFAVSDGALEAMATVRLTVTPVNDVPVAAPLAATTGEAQPVSLTLSGGDVDGDRLSYEVLTGPAHGHLQGSPPEVLYTPVPGFAGLDTFTFRVSDGASDSLPATVSVRVVARTLALSVSDIQPLEGSPVTFSATLADASARPVFAWDFGDGTTSSEATPRHVFPDDGVYPVRVRATDADGTREASLPVTVRNASPGVESLSLPEAPLEAREVELSATAVDPAGSADTLEYLWSFGDGSPEARGPRVRHAFRDDGAFTVVLTVRDEDGGETRTLAPLTVANVPPSATAPERQSLRVGESLSLTLSAQDVAGAEDPLTWRKVSGPGAVTPEGLFTWAPAAEEVGEASVRLEVADDEGGRAEVTFLVEVLRPDPVEEPPGCGCRASGGSSALFAFLFGLGRLVRRRATRPAR